jgi:hypothetical protein
MTRCPVAASCRWHDLAKSWLRMGQFQRIRENKDILLVLLTRAWKGCTCGLDKRVRAAL